MGQGPQSATAHIVTARPSKIVPKWFRFAEFHSILVNSGEEYTQLLAGIAKYVALIQLLGFLCDGIRMYTGWIFLVAVAISYPLVQLDLQTTACDSENVHEAVQAIHITLFSYGSHG